MAKWLARAKVNLVLDVVGPRVDGYHELRTIFQSIELADILSVELADDIVVVCPAPGVPDGPGNLAFRAAARLRERFQVSAGCRITIEKRIPAAAGLGGGSADAAAALVALNELWGLDLTSADLVALASEIGSDVPFMVAGGTCLGAGRGELLTPVATAGRFPIAVVVPPVAVATPAAYQAVDRWPTPLHPAIEPALAALRRGRWQDLAAAVGNTFEAPVAAAEPRIAEVIATIRRVVPHGVVMSGSGSAIAVIAPRPWQVEELVRRLPDCFVWAGLTARAGVSRLAKN